MDITFRKAEESDLSKIIDLLFEDNLGEHREKKDPDSYLKYLQAFREIQNDSNQYLMIVEHTHQIVGTCHLTLLPSLTYCGSKRMLIEGVRIDQAHRNQRIGESMLKEAIRYAKLKQVSIIQLTTNNQRINAMRFYKKMGFEPTHVGFKMHIHE